MPSRTEKLASKKTLSRRVRDLVAIWSHKSHYYLGLYFLFFLWLFAFTGLLLNNSAWKFAEFWPNRKTSEFERQLEAPRTGTDLDQARNILRQLTLVQDRLLHSEIEGSALL
jgi:hypothetical protein